MASGTSRYRYKTDAGHVFFARTDNDPALSAIRGAEPTGAITESITFKVSKRALEVGCNPRHAILKLKDETARDNNLPECLIMPNSTAKYVVILDSATTVDVGTEVTTADGRKWVVASTSKEKMR